jgi:hypothetical protein
MGTTVTGQVSAQAVKIEVENTKMSLREEFESTARSPCKNMRSATDLSHQWLWFHMSLYADHDIRYAMRKMLIRLKLKPKGANESSRFK